MSQALTLRSLLPARLASASSEAGPFVGIDFGTSTTVVSLATARGSVADADGAILTQALGIRQLSRDGFSYLTADKVPSVIGWYEGQLFVGQGAADLKPRLRPDATLWHSFKMDLGQDLGAFYANSELGRNHPAGTILTPADAARTLFQFLKEQIDAHLSAAGQDPARARYAISIPASFEANQRRDLLGALAGAGIPVDGQALIDEPNAAFLSYLVRSAGGEAGATAPPLTLPPDSPALVLVFDFGAGTCDVSILEFSPRPVGAASKNLAISRFEKLGGNDVDRAIVLDVLLPQVYAQNGVKQEDFRTPELNKQLIPKLLRTAEQLKIRACDTLALPGPLAAGPLPAALAAETVRLAQTIELGARRHPSLKLTNPTLTLGQMERVMSFFVPPTASTALAPKPARYEGQEPFSRLRSPLESALTKAALDADDIDYVLLIGGSCKNPFVARALREAFPHSDVLVPRDLQTHVAAGAAIHSLVRHGWGANLIEPITSEPLLFLTKGGRTEVLFRAGTPIPAPAADITGLETQRDGQTVVEIPICVSTPNKVVQTVQVHCPPGRPFAAHTPVRLQCELTPDKELRVTAYVGDVQVQAEPTNPFANRALGPLDLAVLRAERDVNNAMAAQGPKAAGPALRRLAESLNAAGNHLRAAETYELVQELEPGANHETTIGYHYHTAGDYQKALAWEEAAHHRNPKPVTAFNMAMTLRYRDVERYATLMEECLRLDPDYPYANHYYGEYLQSANRDPTRGRLLIQRAFDIFCGRYERDQLGRNDYERLAQCAELLSDRDFAKRVRATAPTGPENTVYDPKNLVQPREERGVSRG
jgi:molecular chaperone DnaK